MSTALWVAFFVAQILFWLWVARYGGARWLAGRTAAAFFFIDPRVSQWEEEGIKLFGWVSLIATMLWFVVGLADPDARWLFPL
jgi:hypothetical protein